MTWVLQHIDHRDGNIRELMVKIATEVYRIIGQDRMEPFLSNVRAAILDNLQASFDKASTSTTNVKSTSQEYY